MAGVNWLRVFVLGCVGAALVVLSVGASAQTYPSEDGWAQVATYYGDPGATINVDPAAGRVGCLTVFGEHGSVLLTCEQIDYPTQFVCPLEDYFPVVDGWAPVWSCEVSDWAPPQEPGVGALTESTFVDWVQFLAGGLGCLVFAAGWHLGKGLG